MLSFIWPLLALCAIAAGERPAQKVVTKHRGGHLGPEEDEEPASPACDKPGTVLESPGDRTACVNYAYGQCTDLDPDGACAGLTKDSCGENADISEKSEGICKKPDNPEGGEAIYTMKGCCPKSCGECTAAGDQPQPQPGAVQTKEEDAGDQSPSGDTPAEHEGDEEKPENEDKNEDGGDTSAPDENGDDREEGASDGNPSGDAPDEDQGGEEKPESADENEDGDDKNAPAENDDNREEDAADGDPGGDASDEPQGDQGKPENAGENEDSGDTNAPDENDDDREEDAGDQNPSGDAPDEHESEKPENADENEDDGDKNAPDENDDDREERKKEVKAYLKNQVQKFLAERADDDEGEDAADPDEEEEEDRHVKAIKELEDDLASMNEFHDQDEKMRKEMESLDLTDPAQVDELGKFSEDFAKCMFRCIHLAHEYFSSAAAAKESCECTVAGSLRTCDECQYLADDKVTDEDGEVIEVESPHATSHISDSHFEGKTSRGRCVLPGDVPEARKINFKGTVLQC